MLEAKDRAHTYFLVVLHAIFVPKKLEKAAKISCMQLTPFAQEGERKGLREERSYALIKIKRQLMLSRLNQRREKKLHVLQMASVNMVRREYQTSNIK
jgi:hypothetical protein